MRVHLFMSSHVRVITPPESQSPLYTILISSSKAIRKAIIALNPRVE